MTDGAANRWFTSTTQQLLAETCQDRPEKTAIAFQEEEMSFNELQQNVDICSEEFEDVLTVGVPDPYCGTKIVSLVRKQPGKELRPAMDLRETCKGPMAEYEIPRESLEWEGQWPMAAEGKMDLKTLQREVEERLAVA